MGIGGGHGRRSAGRNVRGRDNVEDDADTVAASAPLAACPRRGTRVHCNADDAAVFGDSGRVLCDSSVNKELAVCRISAS